jgi:hypothetical protein
MHAWAIFETRSSHITSCTYGVHIIMGVKGVQDSEGEDRFSSEEKTLGRPPSYYTSDDH